MDNQFIGKNNRNIDKMDSVQKLEFLKAQVSCRDPKNGRFTQGHSGNPKGRPPAKRTLRECLNKSFSRKVTVNIDGKPVVTTNLQLASDIIVQTSLAQRDVKILTKILNDFGPMIDLSEELPPPKIKPVKADPTVEMIKNAIFNQMDKEYGVSDALDDQNNLIE